MSIQTTSTRQDITNSFRDDSNIAAALDLEQQIQLVNEIIRPLREAQRKLSKTEKKIDRINLLIDSDIGSASDKKALRDTTKRQLRQRRVQLWEQLKALPSLEKERNDLIHDLAVFRQRHGINL